MCEIEWPKNFPAVHLVYCRVNVSYYLAGTFEFKDEVLAGLYERVTLMIKVNIIYDFL